jgi:hypothetical protein
MTLSRYLALLLITFVGLSALHLGYVRFLQVSCWPGGYERDAWMAYCNSDRYGVYDADAIWHSLEPEVAPKVRAAKVLTLSDSHLQNALSLGGASEWFESRRYPVYMLGVPTAESQYGELLLERLQAHPSVIVFDSSPYFTGGPGAFEKALLEQPVESRERALELREFQDFHRRFCARFPWACGYNFAYFRSRKDGHWIFPAPSGRFLVGGRGVPNDNLRYPTSTRPDEWIPRYPEFLEVARKVIGKLGLPARCVVITAVPTEVPKQGLAHYLAAGLGVTLIDPALPDMMTFDHSHLTPESSRRWTQAFLEQLQPVLDSCIGPAPQPVPGTGG